MPIEFLGTPRSIPSPRAFSSDFPNTQMGAEQFYRAQNYNIILPVNTQNTCLSAKPAPERDFTIRIASPNENSSQSPTPSQAFRSDIIELSLASAPDFSYPLASPWILPLGNVQINSTLPSLIRTLASPKILPLGKMQTSLLLLSLIRIFGRVFADVFDKPSAMPNFVRVLPRRENGCRERTIKRKKNADQRTASRPSRKLSRSA